MDQADKPNPARRVHVERFVFPSETSHLSEQELATALSCLDWIQRAVDRRRQLQAEIGDAFAVHLPAGNWSPSAQQAFELDLAVTNPFTSFDLLMSRDARVIRQLRLYSQAFTGYQLATLEMANRRPWIRKPLPANHDELVALLVHLPDPQFEKWVRLATAVPEHLNVSPPWKFGEMGWLVEGRIANFDTWCYLQRLALMHTGGILERLATIAKTRRPRVIEIGGGYGALAHYFQDVVPTVDYTIVDIPESLVFAAVYLSVIHGPERVVRMDSGSDAAAPADIRLCPNFLFPDLLRTIPSFDLAINTCSLMELTEAQVDFYCSNLAQATRGGAFFEQNGESNRYGVSGLTTLIAKHFATVRMCPAEIVGPHVFPGPGRIWSNG